MLVAVQFAALGILVASVWLNAVRRRKQTSAVRAPARTPGAVGGVGPLRIDLMSRFDDEVVVRLERVAKRSVEPVTCLASAQDDEQLTRWYRRRTLLWMQFDSSTEVVLFAGSRRIVLSLWTDTRAA